MSKQHSLQPYVHMHIPVCMESKCNNSLGWSYDLTIDNGITGLATQRVLHVSCYMLDMVTPFP